MTAIYESVRHDRRYEIDARGVAEFGQDRVLRRFIPWCAVSQIEFAHKPLNRQLLWSVRAADGARIRPKLEYANSLECYNASVGEWRARVPHACRAQFRRTYRQLRWAHALMHLFWAIPALLVYAALGLTYWLDGQIAWDPVGNGCWSIALLFAICVVQNLLCLKQLRLDFDRWYALMEARFTAASNVAPVSSFQIMRWLCPARVGPPEEQPITDDELRRLPSMGPRCARANLSPGPAARVCVVARPDLGRKPLSPARIRRHPLPGSTIRNLLVLSGVLPRANHIADPVQRPLPRFAPKPLSQVRAPTASRASDLTPRGSTSASS